ncbi:MAG: threonylcarbamoyl-AMP synthase [Thermoplasmata archaeon]|nr:threonylcarbamoyl-AMP synthase [Thermoplasmata archaeon]
MADPLAAAVRAVRKGRPILYPTDTLWGLGVRPDDPAGVRRLYALKDRPGGMPVAVAVSSYEELEPFVELSPITRSIVRRWLPGPFTFLLRAGRKARREWTPAVLGESRTVGVRIPDHPVARALLAKTGPLTTTSANRHGHPPYRSASEARRVFGRRVGAYVTGGEPPSGRPSTIVVLTGPRPHVLRRS